MNNSTFTDFFRNILRDLYQNIYRLFGGSLDDQTLTLANIGFKMLTTSIKIIILLILVGFIYWFLVYLTKTVRKLFGLPHRYARIVRATLRYLWFMTSLLAIMSQIGIRAETVTATAKAATWAGFYYVLWAARWSVACLSIMS